MRSFGLEIIESDYVFAIAYVPCHLIREIHELNSVFGYSSARDYNRFDIIPEYIREVGIGCIFFNDNCKDLPASASIIIESYDSIIVDNQKVLRVDSCLWTGYVSTCGGSLDFLPIAAGYYRFIFEIESDPIFDSLDLPLVDCMQCGKIVIDSVRITEYKKTGIAIPLDHKKNSRFYKYYDIEEVDSCKYVWRKK